MTLTELKVICEFLDGILKEADKIRLFVGSIGGGVIIKDMDAKQRSVYMQGYCGGMVSAVTKMTASLGNMDSAFNVFNFSGDPSSDDIMDVDKQRDIRAIVLNDLDKISVNPAYKQS